MFRGSSLAWRPRPAPRLLLASAALSWAVAGLGVVPDAATAPDPFLIDQGGVTVDWRAGTVQTTGGAAADHRMPSAEAARPGAERRATAAARGRMAEALRALPLGSGRHLDDTAVTRAVARARTVHVDHQSNGGALVRLQVAFGDWSEGAPAAEDSLSPAAPLALELPEGQLAAAPLVVVGGQEVPLGSAKFSSAASIPGGVTPLPVRADRKGRLLVRQQPRQAGDQANASASAAEFAGRAAVVYVHKVLR